jgi:hypothetical protein
VCRHGIVGIVPCRPHLGFVLASSVFWGFVFVLYIRIGKEKKANREDEIKKSRGLRVCATAAFIYDHDDGFAFGSKVLGE